MRPNPWIFAHLLPPYYSALSVLRSWCSVGLVWVVLCGVLLGWEPVLTFLSPGWPYDLNDDVYMQAMVL